MAGMRLRWSFCAWISASY